MFPYKFMELSLVQYYTTYVVYYPSLVSWTSNMVFIRDTPRKKRNFIKFITTITIVRDLLSSRGSNYLL
jgi:hypothetical protein